ncbi:MAG: FG-GAP-like repeat-containing protein [Actinomycetota bacterium]
MLPTRRRGAVLLALALLVGTAPAAAQEEGAPEPRAATLPSFNESPGCGGPDGIRGPFATRQGELPATEAVLGPWGDFFGRDIAAVRSQLVRLYLPSPGGAVGVWVHSRVAPALRAVIRNLEREAAAGHSYRIRSWDTGSYRAATIPPHRHFSFHAVGAAIDVNSTTNPHRLDNVLITDMPAWFVRAWTDAGWCWGGAWQTIKDSMHFSWQGPLATPGYQTPAPFPPRTAAATFTRTLSFPTVLGPTAEGGTLLLADLDRDGAADAVRVRPWTPAGHLGLEAAQAIHGFETCATGEATGWPAVDGAARLLADRDGDGRPDLWEIDASGETVVLSIYSFASGFTRRLGRLTTAVPASAGAVFLVGDHDRDRRADLYVVRPGDPATLAVWRGRGFTPLMEATLPFAADTRWRFALGERDGDGIPDLFALGPGNTPALHILTGASAFSGPTETITLPGPGRDGAFAVEDLDGDGRGDLYLLDGAGTLTVHLGGERGGAPDGQLVYWFYEGHDPHWEAGAGCPADPGERFGRIRVAGAGSGTAALHPDPSGGGWALSGSVPGGQPWRQEVTGDAIDLAAVATPAGDRLAVLHSGTGTMVSLFTPAGALTGRVRFGSLDGPASLVVLAAGGAPALGVVASGPEGASLTARALDGTRLGTVPLRLEPIAAAAREAGGHGASEIVLLGTAAEETRLQVLALDGTLRAETVLPAGGRAESLALVSGERPAVLWRNAATGRARVLVFDSALGLVARHTVPPEAGVVLTAVGGDVVVAYRAQRNGTVWVLARDGVTGERRYRTLLPAGFDPAAAAAALDGTLLVAGHRLGDGAVLIDRRTPGGDLLAREQHYLR